MLASILGSIFSGLLGKLLAWFKQNELEQQAALAQELKQHIASLEAAQAAQSAVTAAVMAHQEATEQVTDLGAQLEAIKKWNEGAKGLKSRAQVLQVHVREIRRGK